MRPATLDEYAGQLHLLAAGKPLRRAIEESRPHSMLFWGPPGTGKTTLARLITHYWNAEFITLSAVACAPKSNAVYTAYKLARADAQQSGSLDVPLHLRNAPTKLMKALDYGKGYRYAHDEQNAYVAQENYFPDALRG